MGDHPLARSPIAILSATDPLTIPIRAHESTAWEHAFGDHDPERYWSHDGAWIWSPFPAPNPMRAGLLRQYEAYKTRFQGRAVLDTAADARDELISWWDQDNNGEGGTAAHVPD